MQIINVWAQAYSYLIACTTNPSSITLKRTKKHHPPKPRVFPLIKQKLKATNLMDCLLATEMRPQRKNNKKKEGERPKSSRVGALPT